ncbi:MAG: hypothetical protein HUJ29_02790 [Gammaproteobacteria bacterium]|nr:hypothetical protein [Gammaproteobacteria bacterium]
MNKKLILALLLPFITFTAQAADEGDSSNYYGLTLMEVSGGSPSLDYAPTGILLRLGHRFSYDLAIEFHTASAQTSSTLSLDRLNSVLLRWSAPYERFHLYTMVGLSRVNFTASGTKAVADSGSFGLGARFETSKDYTIHLEWMSYGTSTALKADSINLGLHWDF